MFVLVHQYLYQCYLFGILSRFTVCKLHHVKFPKVEAREPTWLPGANRVPHGKAGFCVSEVC